MDAPTTLPQLFQQAVARFGAKPALGAKVGPKWTSLSYAEIAEAVEMVARGLLAKGFAKGDRVAILAPNSPEWQIVDLGCQHAGLVTVPLYDTLTPDQMAFILRDCGARALVVASDKRWRRLAHLRKTLPALETLVFLESDEKNATTLREITVAGRAAKGKDESAFERAWTGVLADDLATIVYTSGTTGEPKGVMLTHGNLAYNAITVRDFLGIPEDTVGLLFLPLAHSFERTGELVGLSAGSTGYYAESLAELRGNIREVRPTVLFAVPRVFEKIHQGVLAKVRAKSAWERKIFETALAMGAREAEARERGETYVLAAAARALRAVAFRELHQGLGGRLRFFVSGGAPLHPDVARFFWAAGLPIYEGYGLTETSPALTFNAPRGWRARTVGRAIPGTEIRIAEDGEILARGPGVMRGYWGRDEDTRAVISPDGWFRTGDLGALDADGYLSITGRKKDLIVKSNGKNVAPAPIESALEASELVAQAVVIGDNRPYLVALLVPDFEAARKTLGLAGTDAEVAQHAKLRAALDAVVAGVNAKLAHFEQVQKFAVLSRELTQAAGELTPTMKVKRRVVGQVLAKEIEQIYGSTD